MKIGELSKRSGLAASRIRFYEASGLVGRAERGANGYREFPPQTLQTLELIQLAQQAGFSLEEIRGLIPTRGARRWRPTELVAGLKKKVAEIDALQERLATTKSHLTAVIDTLEGRPVPPECAAGAERVLAGLLGKPDAEGRAGAVGT